MAQTHAYSTRFKHTAQRFHCWLSLILAAPIYGVQWWVERLVVRPLKLSADKGAGLALMSGVVGQTLLWTAAKWAAWGLLIPLLPLITVGALFSQADAPKAPLPTTLAMPAAMAWLGGLMGYGLQTAVLNWVIEAPWTSVLHEMPHLLPVSSAILGGIIGLIVWLSLSLFQTKLASTIEARQQSASESIRVANQAVKAALVAQIREDAKAQLQQLTPELPEALFVEFFNRYQDELAKAPLRRLSEQMGRLEARVREGNPESLRKVGQLHTNHPAHERHVQKMLARLYRAVEATEVKDKADSFFDYWQYREVKTA